MIPFYYSSIAELDPKDNKIIFILHTGSIASRFASRFAFKQLSRLYKNAVSMNLSELRYEALDLTHTLLCHNGIIGTGGCDLTSIIIHPLNQLIRSMHIYVLIGCCLNFISNQDKMDIDSDDGPESLFREIINETDDSSNIISIISEYAFFT